MSNVELKKTAQALAVKGKGILAADESAGTIAKRFETIGLESTEITRRDYREFLFATDDLERYISGVILYEETLAQRSQSGLSLVEMLQKKNIIPGIKVDTGLVNLAGSQNEKVTQGLDGLEKRLESYKEMGALFAKWRAVFNIGDNKPSLLAVQTNAYLLARYARICQDIGIVPIVEPEILMTGEHSLQTCQLVSENILHEVFHALYAHGVLLEGIILKPSMVTPGEGAKVAASVTDVAIHTLEVLLRTVPAAVPSINFLSGGQTPMLSTQHLNEMHVHLSQMPWNLSFSYGRALQAPSLEIWKGKSENIPAAQAALHQRAKLNSLACFGQYQVTME